MLLRIATYNTQAGLPGFAFRDLWSAYLYTFRLKGFPLEMTKGMERALLDAISTDADILCLNEIPSHWIRAAKEVLANKGYKRTASSSTHSWLRWSVGTIIASKTRGFHQEIQIRLPHENTFAGGGGTAALYLNQFNIVIVATHLGWGWTTSSQIARLAVFCATQKEIGSKVIIAGDFNRTDLRKTLLCKKHDLRDATRPTYPSWNPRWSLDHILYDPALEVARYGTFESTSDHLGLYAEVEIP